MSKRTSELAGGSGVAKWRSVAVAAALMLFASIFTGLMPVSAQDATPTAVACVSPGLPPGEPTAEDMASPVAMEEMDMGSPEAMPPAVAPEMPVGTAADEATAAAIEAALLNYGVCFNESIATSDFTKLVGLETENFWITESGSANPYDRVAEMQEDFFFTSVEVVDVSNEVTYDDGRAGADIQVVLNGNFQTGFTSFLVLDGDTWKYDDEVQISAEPEADLVAVKGVALNEIVDEATGAKTYEIALLGSPEIPATEAIVLNVTSAATNTEAHEAFVVMLPEGTDPALLLDETFDFSTVQFIGGVFEIYPGQTIDTAFLNLAPGTYTIVCFFPGPDGMPHLANGMVTQFTVIEPAA